MGSAEAKASEMEHAIRKHCTIHFDEDPYALYEPPWEVRSGG